MDFFDATAALPDRRPPSGRAQQTTRGRDRNQEEHHPCDMERREKGLIRSGPDVHRSTRDARRRDEIDLTSAGSRKRSGIGVQIAAVGLDRSRIRTTRPSSSDT